MTKETHPDIRRTLLFLTRDDEILLAMKKRGHGEGKWNGVGGKLEAGETVEQALIRECQEEIGVTPIDYWRVAEHDFTQDADTAEPWNLRAYAYLCDDWEGEPTESEEMQPRWFKLDNIPYADMWEADRSWLPLVLGKKVVKGTYVFDSNNRLVEHSIEEVAKV